MQLGAVHGEWLLESQHLPAIQHIQQPQGPIHGVEPLVAVQEERARPVLACGLQQDFALSRIHFHLQYAHLGKRPERLGDLFSRHHAQGGHGPS